MERSRVDFDELLRTCIHCGLCLNDCPTYRMTGDEAHSPRGRLMVLRQLIDPAPGSAWQPDREPVDLCLGCRGCETVCPSGVPYGQLLDEGRQRLPDPDDRYTRMVRLVVRHVLPRRRLLAISALLGRAVVAAGVPTGSFARLLGTMPGRHSTWPRVKGPRRGDVAVLAGCAQPVFSPRVLPATLRLIERAGARPYVPRHQSCCGALAAHAGDRDQAREFGRRMIQIFEGADEVVIPSAGCSAHLRNLAELFAGDADWEARAAHLARRCIDLVPWLHARRDRITFRGDDRRIVFQRACHLRHAQGIDGAAEAILEGISGVEVLQAPRADLCCGAAGAWSMEYPDMARQRRDEKMHDLRVPGPDLVLTANPGCELFLDAASGGIPVQHLAEYLASLLPES